MTFGPTAFVDQVEKTFGNAQADLPGEGTFPSDPPTGAPVTIPPTSHGSGFLNSGVLFDPGAGPGAHIFQVTFSTPGVYSFRCIIHSNISPNSGTGAGKPSAECDGNARRAIDIHEGGEVDESAFKALVRQAVALNSSGKSRPSKEAKS